MMLIKLRRLVYKKLPIVLILLSACDKPKSIKKDISFKKFDVVLYSSFSQAAISESDDGEKGSIILAQDTIYFTFGYDINNLSEKDPIVIYFPYDQDSLKQNLDYTLVDTSKIIYTKKANFDIDEFRKQNVFFEKISNRLAKITIPRNFMKGGITGVYVDSLESDEGGRLKFNFYASKLDSLKQEYLLKSIRSIKFKI